MAITALTRNQMVGVTRHVGSNPTLSANLLERLLERLYGSNIRRMAANIRQREINA